MCMCVCAGGLSVYTDSECIHMYLSHVCVYVSIYLFVALCLRVFSLVCHSGKDNHKLAGGENVSRWTVCLWVCNTAWLRSQKVPVLGEVCGE